MAKSSFVNSIKQRGLIAPHLENYFSKGKFPDSMMLEVNSNKERDTAFHPSGDALPCARELFAKRKGLLSEGKYPASLQKIFQIGHMYHAWIQHIVCHELGFCDEDGIEREFRATLDGKVLDNSKDWRKDPEIKKALGWMRGHSDLVPVHIPGRDEPILVDIKTVASFMFTEVGADTDTWLKYEAQAKLYLDWNDLETAVVLYVKKDTPHDFKERIVKRDHEFVEMVYEKWEAVAIAERDGLVPACTCGDEDCKASKLDLAA